MSEKIIAGNQLLAELLGYPYYMPDCYQFRGNPILGGVTFLGNVYAKRESMTTYDDRVIPVFYKSDGKNMCREYAEPILINPNFHYSWDKLMPVVEFVERIELKDKFYTEFLMLNGTNVGVYAKGWDNGSILFHASATHNKSITTKKEAIWNCIVDYADWYKRYMKAYEKN